METQLKKWDADVDALAAKGEKASAEARTAYYERIKDLRASRDVAQKTFQEIRAASESAARADAGRNGSGLGSDGEISGENVVGPQKVSDGTRATRVAQSRNACSDRLERRALQRAFCCELPCFALGICNGALPHKELDKSGYIV